MRRERSKHLREEGGEEDRACDNRNIRVEQSAFLLRKISCGHS